MATVVSGYFEDSNENNSEEHIFIDNKRIPLCNSTEWKKGPFRKTRTLNADLLKEMCRKDSLEPDVSCSKCSRMIRDIVENDFWRVYQ